MQRLIIGTNFRFLEFGTNCRLTRIVALHSETATLPGFISNVMAMSLWQKGPIHTAENEYSVPYSRIQITSLEIDWRKTFSIISQKNRSDLRVFNIVNIIRMVRSNMLHQVPIASFWSAF